MIMFKDPKDAFLQAYARSPAHPCKVRVFQALLRLLKGATPTVHVQAGGGLEFRFDPNDHVGRGLLFRGWHEELTTLFLRKNVLPGDVACVAGVHIGYHAVHLARHLESGVVVGFEPAPKTLANALINVRLNRVENRVKLVCQGLGDDCAYVPMADPPLSNTGAATLRGAETEASCYFGLVDRLDASIDRLNVTRIDVLLLDVEGFEWRALRGLGQLRPRLLVLETDPRFHEQMGESQSAFFDYVRGLGYSLYAVTGEPVTAGGWFSEGNIVAVHQTARGVQWASMALFRNECGAAV